jgi:cell division protein FtsI (penicillin-binding protein 3)
VAWYPHTGATGAGSLSGATFKDIAELIYAQSPLMQTAPTMKGDTTRFFSPVTKAGDRKSLEMVMNEMEVYYRKNKESGEWVRTQVTNNGVREQKVIAAYSKDRVPDVTDMGLKDAIFLLENRGLKVIAEGTGVVKSQSLEEGRFINKGETIRLVLR